VAKWKSWEETEKEILRIFDGKPGFIDRALTETKNKYVDKEVEASVPMPTLKPCDTCLPSNSKSSISQKWLNWCSGFIDRALTETKNKYVDKEGLRRELTAFKAAWPELKERIRKQIIPFEEVRRRLKLVGAPYEPEQLGVSRARFRQIPPLPNSRSSHSSMNPQR